MVIDRITRLQLVKTFIEPIVNTALKNGVKLLKEKVPICGALSGSILSLLEAFYCALVSCRARPGIPSYPSSRDVTCYVRWRAYGIAGQVRNDTVNERFGKNLEGFSKASRRNSAPN